MIAFDFEYYRPSTMEECMQIYINLKTQGKKAIYFGGGTEIICRARANDTYFDAVIDIKSIEECNVLTEKDNKLIIGSAVTLNKLCESAISPLLTMTSKWTADHTSRNKITIGGNICGVIPFKEAALPFLLYDSLAVTAGEDTIKTLPFDQAFDDKMQLKAGELLLQVIIDKQQMSAPFYGVKKTKTGQFDYPIVSIAAVVIKNKIRTAFSGLCSYPFRNSELDKALNNKKDTIDKRVDNAMKYIVAPIVSNIQASADYREFVFRNALSEMLHALEGVC